MDRPIVYNGALPQTQDILYNGKFAMVGQAYQNMALLGINTVVAGLACLPTSPTADLRVSVGVGSIYQIDPTDATAYGDLGVDNANVVKQGILPTAVTLTITPPGTAGFSQVFLVQAILSDIDAGQMVLSYYNSSNPALPYSGPANSGISQFTTRTCKCAIALKAGVAATTGTQTTPTPDAGYVALYSITVANGQTQITSGNISQIPTAPFFPTLPSVPAGVLNGIWDYVGTDTGAANAYVISFVAGQPIPVAYVAGMTIKFKAVNACTGASTINVNGLGNVVIRRASGVALAANDIISGQVVSLTYDGTVFQMVNYLGAAATSNTNTTVNIPYIADTGAVNALIGTYSPAIVGGTQIAGLFLSIKLANTITGACTINVNGLGAKALLTGDLQNPPYNFFLAGEIILIVYDGTQYQIVNSNSNIYRKPNANITLYVNGAIGNDANDGVSNTVGHALATIQGGVNKAFTYAPSGFSITIVVAPGTYNENVGTPAFAGPGIIIDGLSTSSVLVNGGSLAGACFTVTGANSMTVKNLTVQNSSITNPGFFALAGGVMTTQNTASNAVGTVFGAQAGYLNPGNHTFSGSSYALFSATFGGSMILGATYTFSTAISVALATCYGAANGSVSVSNVTPIFVNPSFVSGAKYSAGLNGIVTTNGLGVNFFPGSVAGSTNTGGQYS